MRRVVLTLHSLPGPSCIIGVTLRSLRIQALDSFRLVNQRSPPRLVQFRKTVFCRFVDAAFNRHDVVSFINDGRFINSSGRGEKSFRKLLTQVRNAVKKRRVRTARGRQGANFRVESDLPLLGTR